MNYRIYNFFKTVAHNTILLTALSILLFAYFPPKLSLKIFGKYLSFTQGLMVLSVLFVVIYLWYEYRNKLLFIPEKILTLFGVLSGFLIVAGISTVFSLGFSNVFFVRILSLVSIIIIVFLFSVLPREKINSLLLMMAAGAIISSILGILQFYFFGDSASPAYWLGDRRNHLFATGFGNFSSLFGTSMSLFFPLFWGLSFGNYINKRNFWALVAVFSGIGILLSFSRSALLAGLITYVGLLAYFWFRLKNKKFLIVSVLLMVLVTSITLSFNPPRSIKSEALSRHEDPFSIFIDRFNFLSEAGGVVKNKLSDSHKKSSGLDRFSEMRDYSAYSRIAFHQTGWKMLINSPENFLFGFGLRGFSDNWEEYKDRNTPLSTNHPDSHSVFLESLTSSGFFGFILFLSFFALLLYGLIKIGKKDPLAVSVAVGLAGLLIDGVFHDALYSKYLWMIVGVGIAVIYANLNIDIANKNENTFNYPKNR